jgi:ketosteroid isomerase-like protein
MGDLKLWGDEFYASGDLVVVSGNYAMNLLPPGSTLAIADTGKYLEVWRRQLGGSWLIAWETFNSSLPVPDLSTGS